MKHLKLVSALLACVGATAAMAAERNLTHFVTNDAEGSQLARGDVLVADGDGKVALYRANKYVATLHDPDNIAAERSSGPMYITDADGNAVRGDLAAHQGDLYLSHDAPQIVYFRREFVQARAAANQESLAKAASSVDMTLHGGNVLTSNKTMAIFWGAWGSPGDIISGVDSFFGGWGGSGMAKDSTEYHGTSNGNVTATSSYLGHTI